MRSTCLSLGILLSATSFAGSFTIQDVFPSDSAGYALTPKLGEPFWMTVRYQVGQNTVGSMQVSAPGAYLNSGGFLSQHGARQATYGPLVHLYDGPMPVRVQIGDALTDVSITPTSASRGVEYHTPRHWQAEFGAAIQFKFGASSKLEWIIPRAPSFGFQQVQVTRQYDGQLVAQDVYRLLNVNQIASNFFSTSSSVRINAQTLRSVKFDALKKLPNDVKAYVKSETYIESGDRNVKNLVSAALPKNFQKNLSVYDAAQALYLAVITKLQYVDNPGGGPSAAQALRTGYGDCGFFASAFSAACRNAGIPARPIAGFLKGSNEWHVWAEFYVPNHGWVPVDPSFADGLDPQGRYPLYFGVIPELNERVATAIGFDHSFGKYKVPLLQSPYAITDVKKVLSARAWSYLVETN